MVDAVFRLASYLWNATHKWGNYDLQKSLFIIRQPNKTQIKSMPDAVQYSVI